jgi:hypothetical protein
MCTVPGLVRGEVGQTSKAMDLGVGLVSACHSVQDPAERVPDLQASVCSSIKWGNTQAGECTHMKCLHNVCGTVQVPRSR